MQSGLGKRIGEITRSMYSLFKYDFTFFIIIKYGSGWQFSGSAASLGEFPGLDKADESLHYGMVSGIHVRAQRERTFSLTVECWISVRGYNPTLEKSKQPTWNRTNQNNFLSPATCTLPQNSISWTLRRGAFADTAFLNSGELKINRITITWGVVSPCLRWCHTRYAERTVGSIPVAICGHWSFLPPHTGLSY